MTERPARWTSWERGDIVLAGLVLLHLVVKAAFLPRVLDARLRGDETTYVRGAGELAGLVRDTVALGPLDLADFQTSIVGHGWFMPGMPLVLAPLFVVHPEAGLAEIRVYLGTFSLLLLVATVLVVRRVLGRGYAAALLVFPALVPMWVIFSYSAWGDLSAGLLVILMLACLLHLARKMRDGVAPTLADGARLGLLTIATLYLRSSALPLVAGLLVLVAVAVVESGSAAPSGAGARCPSAWRCWSSSRSSCPGPCWRHGRWATGSSPPRPSRSRSPSRSGTRTGSASARARRATSGRRWSASPSRSAGSAGRASSRCSRRCRTTPARAPPPGSTPAPCWRTWPLTCSSPPASSTTPGRPVPSPTASTISWPGPPMPATSRCWPWGCGPCSSRPADPPRRSSPAS